MARGVRPTPEPTPLADAVRRFARAHPEHPLRVFDIAQRTKSLVRCEHCRQATVVARRSPGR